VIRVGQVLSQQREIRERQLAAREALQHDREAACRARRLDPAVRRVLRHVQHARAVDEHRRAAFTEIQPARIQFCQGGDEGGGRGALRTCEALHLRDEIEIGERVRRGHTLCIPSSFSTAQDRAAVHRTAARNGNASIHRGGSSRANVVDSAARSRGRCDRDPVAREKRVKCFFTEARTRRHS
jgi:hypothetical protein